MYRLLITVLFAVGIVFPFDLSGSTDHPPGLPDDPESQVEYYYGLAKAVFYTQPDSSLVLSYKALTISRTHKLAKWEAKVQLKIGRRHQASGEIDSARYHIEPALASLRALDDSTEIGMALRIYSALLSEQGKTDLAIANLMECIGVYRGIKDSTQLAYTLNAVGANYYSSMELDKAESYFQESLELFQMIKGESGQSMVLSNLANIALQKGHFKEAVQITQEAIQRKLKLGDKYGLGEAYNTLGVAQFKLGNIDESEEAYLKSLSLREGTDHAYGIAESKLNLGSFYFTQLQFGKAEKFLDEALSLASSMEAKELMVYILNDQVKLYRDRDPDKALYFMDSLRVMDNIMFKAQKAETGAQLEAQYQSEQKALKIENLEQKQRISDEATANSEREWMILSIGFVALVVFLILLAFLIFRQRKLNLELRVNIGERMARENQLQLVNDELNTLVFKSSHDLKSPLNSIKGLVEVARDEENLETVHQYMGMMHQRLDQLTAFVTNLLSIGQLESQASRVTEVHPARLLESIISGLQNMEGISELEIKQEIPGDLILKTDELTLRSALQNLVSNAAKYQKMDAEDSFCRIGGSIENGYLKITVQDNGIGIKSENLPRLFDNFTRFSTQAEGNGIGLYYVRKSILKLGGNIVAQSEFGKGTEFVLTLPSLN